jgi:hypothetical protein
MIENWVWKNDYYRLQSNVRMANPSDKPNCRQRLAQKHGPRRGTTDAIIRAELPNKRVEYLMNHYNTARGSSSGLFQEVGKKTNAT